MTDDGVDLFWTIFWRLAWIATGVLFLLKLTRWVDWSWWYIGTPIYIGLAMIFWLFVIAFTLKGAGALWGLIFNGRKPKPGERPQDYAHSLRHVQPLDSIKYPRH